MGTAKIKDAIRAMPCAKRHDFIRSILASEVNENAKSLKKLLRDLTPKFEKAVLKGMEEAHARSESSAS